MPSWEEDSDVDMTKVMFICGAQVTTDGDWVGHTFTVFPRFTPPEEAAGTILHKISNDMAELGISESSGALEFVLVQSWCDFVNIEIDDHTKMRALSTSIVTTFMEALLRATNETMEQVITMPWVPCWDHEGED